MERAMEPFRLRVLGGVLPFLLVAPAFAQTVPTPPTRAEAEAALVPAAHYTNAQLDQMLAPIALYPDSLLTPLLMAATFPQQIVEAGQWLQDPRNAALHGDALVAALEPLPWDPSVKTLVAFPQVIAMLNAHLEWTEALGTAFAEQQADTMARIQFLRQRALAVGTLSAARNLRVEHDGPDIVIEPAEPDILYVPVYNPAEAYGAWPDEDYPPVYVPPPPDLYAGPIGAGIAFGVGLGIVAPLWGWGHADWRHHSVEVDPDRYRRISREAHGARVEDRTWHHAGPVAWVPEAARPRPAPAPAAAPPPPGTVRPAVVAQPRLPGPEHRPPGAPPAAHPAAAPAAPPPGHPTPPPGHPQGPQPAAAPAAPPPGPEHRPPGAPPAAHPAAAPAAPPPGHPTTPPGHPQGPQPAAAPAAPPPGPEHRPPGAPPAARPAAAPAAPPPGHPAPPPGHPEPPHPVEHAPPHPAEHAPPPAPHPAPPAPHPAAAPAAPPHPAPPPPPHPAAAPAPAPHPAPPPPHPVAAPAPPPPPHPAAAPAPPHPAPPPPQHPAPPPHPPRSDEKPGEK